MPVSVLLKAVFGATLMISVSEAVPNLDVTASCRATAKVNEELRLTESQDTDRCMHDEEQARAVLIQKWTSYPAADRTRCVDETMIASPSYVDVLTCLQDAQDAEKLNAPLRGSRNNPQ